MPKHPYEGAGYRVHKDGRAVHLGHPLRAWMDKHGVGVAGMCRLLGVGSRMTIYRYLSGESIPNRKIMAKLKEVTNGAIGPGHFYD